MTSAWSKTASSRSSRQSALAERDQLGMIRSQVIRTQSEFVHRAGAVVVDHDIGMSDQRFRQLEAFDLFQIEAY